MPTELRAVIVDDEASARASLYKLLTDHPYIRIVAEAATVAEALAACNHHRPNLIFLDIELRGPDGFTLLPQLDYLPAIIFTTGFNEYAVRAFEVNAIDFLMKPIEPERLAHALERLYHPPLHLRIGPFLENDLICLFDGKRMRFVFATEISFIEAEGNYTTVYLAQGLHFCMRQSLAEWKVVLPQPPFVAAYRSLMVNLRKIESISACGRKQLELHLRGIDAPKKLGRFASQKLRKALKEARSSLLVP
jgi:two-component system LytT family response regulator